MATLTAKLTLTSGNATSDALNLSVSDILSIGEPVVNISRVSLVGDATASDILTASNSVTTYVYVKNTDATNHIKLYTGASELFGIIWPGQFSFFAIIDGEGLKAQANTGNCILEYAYWTKS
jgi:hypothetical protein